MAATGSIATFLALPRYAVVGASTSRAKFGNKVFRALESTFPGCVDPVNARADDVEGVPTATIAEAAAKVATPAELGLSVILPPAVGQGMVEEALALGVRHFWLQPGAESDSILTAIRAQPGADVIAGGPCVLVELGFSDDD